MAFEKDLLEFMEALPSVGNDKVWWDTMPDGIAIPTSGAFIILNDLGGTPKWYVDRGPGSVLPSERHMRVMVTLQTRDQLLRNSLKRLIGKSLYQSAFNVRAYNEPQDIWEPALKLFGSQQQFSFWYPDP